MTGPDRSMPSGAPFRRRGPDPLVSLDPSEVRNRQAHELMVMCT